MGKKRILSGMRSSGRLHLGNYLGATKGMLELQNDPQYETFYMVADLHGLTTPYDKENFSDATKNVIRDYLAAGLDPKKSVLFVQSQVPEHIELAYYFSTVTTIAKMSHLPTFKEKVKQYPEHNTMALLNYPVLMASDILVYKAGLVPVGVDQEPHIEVAREIARRMNADFGLDFPEPQRFATKGEYVPSLSGEGKMSKSVEGSYIALTDDLETIKRKIAKIPTDSGTGKISIFKNDPISLEDVVRYEYIHDGVQQGVAALMTLVELFMGQQKRKDCDKLYETSGIKYSDLKRELSEAIYLELKPIQERHAEITDEYLNEVIRDGARRAREVATVTVKEVKEKMGLLV